MTFTDPDYTARIRGVGGDPDVPVTMRTDAGQITLDVATAPRVTASGITLALPDPALLDDLDPRENRRLVIDAGGRTFDLGIRRTVPARGDGTVQVELASDEALLDDFSQLVDDDGAWSSQASVRAVCDYVLNKIGAALELGGPDADVTAYWQLTNLLANPSLETDAANWMSVGNSGSLTRVAIGTAPAGGYALRFAATVAGAVANVAPVAALSDLSATPGRWYVFAAYTVPSAAAGQARAILQWRNANGVAVVSSTDGVTMTTSSAGWTRLTVVGQAPAGATHVLPYVQTLGNTVGALHYVDAAMFYEGNRVVSYADPSTGQAGYTWAWQDVAHKSASTRTPVVERDPDALMWRAGTSGLDFLRPLLLSAGLRLVCDEQRRWTTRDAEYRAAGSQTFRYGVNIIGADEELSREDERWFDGCVVVYQWTDRDGIRQERIDAWALTATPTKVIRREVDAPYPGPGRAEYAVRRAQGTGRTVTGTKQATWTEAAEQVFSAVLEGTPIQTGIAEKVVFDIGANTVTTTSRTIDTPAAAWVLIPAGEAWLDSPIGESWTEEVI